MSLSELRIHFIIRIVILDLAFLLRLDSLHIPSYHWMVDYNRDFLIANHIVSYLEMPLKGPDGQFGAYSESPVYYYLLAAFLAINNNIIFLALCNLVLQVLTIAIIYYIARNLFG